MDSALELGLSRKAREDDMGRETRVTQRSSFPAPHAAGASQASGQRRGLERQHNRHGLGSTQEHSSTIIPVLAQQAAPAASQEVPPGFSCSGKTGMAKLHDRPAISLIQSLIGPQSARKLRTEMAPPSKATAAVESPAQPAAGSSEIVLGLKPGRKQQQLQQQQTEASETIDSHPSVLSKGKQAVSIDAGPPGITALPHGQPPLRNKQKQKQRLLNEQLAGLSIEQGVQHSQADGCRDLSNAPPGLKSVQASSSGAQGKAAPLHCIC